MCYPAVGKLTKYTAVSMKCVKEAALFKIGLRALTKYNV